MDERDPAEFFAIREIERLIDQAKMTAEEKAVIAAAEAWYDHFSSLDDRVGGTGPTANLRTAIRELRRKCKED